MNSELFQAVIASMPCTTVTNDEFEKLLGTKGLHIICSNFGPYGDGTMVYRINCEPCKKIKCIPAAPGYGPLEKSL